MEAFGLKGESKMTESEASFKTLTFLDQFENLAFNEHAGVGVGMEKRFRSEDLTGFELVYNSNMIHLTALNLKKEGK
jgi:oligoribonuclease (3'-5' exoribonuclease)